jgi:hypothetical protein
MKRSVFIIAQIAALAGLNYFWVIDSGLIYQQSIAAIALLPIIYFNAGLFLALYTTIQNRNWSAERANLAINFNSYIMVSTIMGALFIKCTVGSVNLWLNFLIGICMLYLTVICLKNTRKSYLALAGPNYSY